MWIPGQNDLLLNTDYIQKIDVEHNLEHFKIIATMNTGETTIIGNIGTRNGVDGMMKWLRNELGLKLFNDN